MYKVMLRDRKLNEFHTKKAAYQWARAYNKLATGMHHGATVLPPKG